MSWFWLYLLEQNYLDSAALILDWVSFLSLLSKSRFCFKWSKNFQMRLGPILFLFTKLDRLLVFDSWQYCKCCSTRRTRFRTCSHSHRRQRSKQCVRHVLLSLQIWWPGLESCSQFGASVLVMGGLGSLRCEWLKCLVAQWDGICPKGRHTNLRCKHCTVFQGWKVRLLRSWKGRGVPSNCQRALRNQVYIASTARSYLVRPIYCCQAHNSALESRSLRQWSILLVNRRSLSNTHQDLS